MADGLKEAKLGMQLGEWECAAEVLERQGARLLQDVDVFDLKRRVAAQQPVVLLCCRVGSNEVTQVTQFSVERNGAMGSVLVCMIGGEGTKVYANNPKFVFGIKEGGTDGVAADSAAQKITDGVAKEVGQATDK